MNEVIFQYAGIAMLIIFYAIYAGKMIMQKRKGIQTDQMARGKKTKRLFRTELTMKVATYCVVIVEVVSVLLNTTLFDDIVRITGLFLAVIGTTVFGVAVYTMQDSWRAGIAVRDKTELVTTGIFRISRNPAFLAFDLVYLGFLIMFFNWILLLFTFWAAIMLHLQIKQEERFLSLSFGEDYLRYKNQTKRYIGKKQCVNLTKSL